MKYSSSLEQCCTCIWTCWRLFDFFKVLCFKVQSSLPEGTITKDLGRNLREKYPKQHEDIRLPQKIGFERKINSNKASLHPLCFLCPLSIKGFSQWDENGNTSHKIFAFALNKENILVTWKECTTVLFSRCYVVLYIAGVSVGVC